MAAPELVVPGVYRVDAIGLKNAISVLLVEDGEGWTLVDTGVPPSAERIKAAITALGSGPEDLKRIFLTHHHGDHTGGLKDLLEWAPDATVAATAHEADIISGRRGYDPSSSPIMRFALRNAKPPGVPVGEVLQEGDLVAGFRVISTPGHTLGHASLLRDSDGLLFTADAFGSVLPRRIRAGVGKMFCTDPQLAKRSAEKLLEESFDPVVVAHGPVLRSDAETALRDALDRSEY
jgi:glyoxylase-like metal-dependent hydrolase (beta-lactamase superfamily II)